MKLCQHYFLLFVMMSVTVWITESAVNKPKPKVPKPKPKPGPTDPLITSKEITADGGVLKLDNTASANFPVDYFQESTIVEMSKTQNPIYAEIFSSITSILWNLGGRVSYEVHVTFSAVMYLNNSFLMTLEIPQNFTLPTNHEYCVFYLSHWEDGDETMDEYDLLDIFNQSTTEISFFVTPSLFAYSPTNYSFSAVFLLSLFDNSVSSISSLSALPPSSTSEGNKGSEVESVGSSRNLFSTFVRKCLSLFSNSDTQSKTLRSNQEIVTPIRHLGSSQCLGSSLTSPPLHGTLRVTSPFGRSRRRKDGTIYTHKGTDYAASIGTPVFAMKDGIYHSCGTLNGFGNYVAISHSDGSLTLYAHLSDASWDSSKCPPLGSTATRGSVQSGTQIALSGISGLTGSSGQVEGPHLHVEYRPSQSLSKTAARIDVEPCLSFHTGSISIGDNGAAADDSFSLYIDSLLIGTSPIGAVSYPLSISQLRSGPHELVLVVAYAPDNVGTWYIQLADGLTFSDGSTYRTSSDPQGTQISFTIIVPAG